MTAFIFLGMGARLLDLRLMKTANHGKRGLGGWLGESGSPGRAVFSPVRKISPVVREHGVIGAKRYVSKAAGGNAHQALAGEDVACFADE